MSILVVDDSPETRSALQLILEDAGYQQVLVAESAHAAFQRLGLANAGAPAGRTLCLRARMTPEAVGRNQARGPKAHKHARDRPGPWWRPRRPRESLATP